MHYELSGLRGGILWLDFRSKITGNLDETEDGAEVSAFNSLKTLQSEKGLNRNRDSLFFFENRAISLYLKY
jgi:hypothetical protein